MPNDNAFTYGFRIVGDCRNDRRLVDWPSAFRAYAECDDRAELDRESYLSAFCFGVDMREKLNRTGTTKGFDGHCCAPFLWFDIDAGELTAATDQARRLSAGLIDRYRLAGDELLIFFSGQKGFHIGLPTVVFNPDPSERFHRYCRRFAELTAERCGVTIDSGVYDRVRAFRAPNSRHPKTGRYKRRLQLEELLDVRPEKLVEFAAAPIPFEVPLPSAPNRQAHLDWLTACGEVDKAADSVAHRSGSPIGETLNRQTLEFIRNGATEGNRHRLLFSAAANLAEFACGYQLAWALLSDSALDSGLPPSEVRRQILCGLEHRGGRL